MHYARSIYTIYLSKSSFPSATFGGQARNKLCVQSSIVYSIYMSEPSLSLGLELEHIYMYTPSRTTTNQKKKGEKERL